MIINTLAFMIPTLFETLLILIVLGVLVDFVITLAKYIFHSNDEKRRLRLEVGKLADELEQMRKQKGTEVSNSMNGSG